MIVNIGNVLSRPYEMKAPLCDCCERRPATKRVWLRDEVTLALVQHPMYHNICARCLWDKELDELFWHKVEVCDGLIEDIPPQLLAFLKRPKTWEDLSQLVGKLKEAPGDTT